MKKTLSSLLSAALAAALLLGGAAAQPAFAADAPAATSSNADIDGPQFEDLNGFMWFYNTYFDYKFTDITADLDDLKSKGIRVLGFFSPYHGDKTLCDGCDPLDFYNVSPQNGTIEDWKTLVAEAHERGMKVVSYFVNIYMDEKSEFFKTAEQQYAAGDRTSNEVSAIT